ncbi:MAG: acetylxylan esterase [Lentisphaeria bacterium]|nr:acetylxylan esterase [Lentisphaeria bacterium]
MVSMTQGNALQDFFLDRFRKHRAQRAAKLRQLKNAADAEKHVSSLKEKIKKCFHAPAEKTPLNARTTGVLEYPEFTLEKILFQSRPGYTVSANFLLPRKREGKIPAILFLCGHCDEGKAYTVYQTAMRGLVKSGFAVLTFDPIGQGERRQFNQIKECRFSPTEQHNLIGKQLLPVGEDLFSWHLWDAVRALDYLESRAEIDPGRIGAHGNSGGGTTTIWLAALDERVAWAAPSSAVTTWLHNVENEMATDWEQIPPLAAKQGLDYSDFLMAAAPRPLMLLGQKHDFFDPRGFDEAEEDLRKVYTLLGVPEKLGHFLGDSHHGLSGQLREQAYKFFCRCANLPEPAVDESEITLCAEEELYAAPGGDVYNLEGEKKLHQLAADKAAALKKKRKTPARKVLAQRLSKLLGIGQINEPYVRRLIYRYFLHEGAHQNYSRFGLETEPGRVMAVLHRSAKKALYYNFNPIQGETVLYIPSIDCAEELLLREPEKEDALYSLDYRGVGECASTACEQMPVKDFFYYYGADFYFTSLYMMWGESYCGKRVKDILEALTLIGPVAASEKVTIEAHGFGCIPALLAAVISPYTKEVKLSALPASWEEMVSAPLASFDEAPVSAMPYRILEAADIPELIRVLENAGIKVTCC